MSFGQYDTKQKKEYDTCFTCRIQQKLKDSNYCSPECAGRGQICYRLFKIEEALKGKKEKW